MHNRREGVKDNLALKLFTPPKSNEVQNKAVSKHGLSDLSHSFTLKQGTKVESLLFPIESNHGFTSLNVYIRRAAYFEALVIRLPPAPKLLHIPFSISPPLLFCEGRGEGGKVRIMYIL